MAGRQGEALNPPEEPPRDPRMVGPAKAELEERLALIEERMTGLFFLMCRDVMAARSVEGLVRAVSGTKFEFEPPELEEFARRLAKALVDGGPDIGPLDTKERREWIEGLPKRTRDSRFFEAVLKEMGRFPHDDSSRRTLIAEVVRRERADPDHSTRPMSGHVTGDRPER